jgi:hypothetical protein
MRTANGNWKRWLTVAVVLTALAASSANGQSGYAIDWWTADGGGAGPSQASGGGQYTLSGTIGQPDARNHPQPMAGGGYTLTSGFWVIPECPAIPADYDGDCDVDQADHRAFEACASGSGYAYAGDCDDRDFDHDADVDQSDFAAFQRCYSGSDVPADPNCVD